MPIAAIVSAGNVMAELSITKLIHASILGDGFFYKVAQENLKANTHYMLKQTSKHKDYVEWMADQLDWLTPVRIDTKPAYTDARGYNCAEQLILKTMRHRVYKRMYNELYVPLGKSHIKRLNPHYLKDLDWQCLAMLYMDDGWLEVDKRKTKESYVRVGIATNAFTYSEVIILRDLLKEKFSITGSVFSQKKTSDQQQHLLRFSKDDARRLIDGVSRFVFPSYEYKLAID